MSRLIALLLVAAGVSLAGAETTPHYRVVKGTPPDPISKMLPKKRMVFEDTVLVWVLVGTDGRVRDARIERSVAHYDSVCLEAARQWRFEPGTDESGRAMEMGVHIPFHFRTTGEPRATP